MADHSGSSAEFEDFTCLCRLEFAGRVERLCTDRRGSTEARSARCKIPCGIGRRLTSVRGWQETPASRTGARLTKPKKSCGFE